MLFASQLLYSALVIAGIFHWMRFYPGNRVETAAIVVGLSLSIIALLLALSDAGLKRLVGLWVGVITIFLWVLSAVASVAI